MAEYVLLIWLQISGFSATALPLATFTGPNAMQDCVANGKRIEANGMFGRRVSAHCERIDR